MTKLVQPKKASPGRLEKAVAEAVQDICNFHSYAEELYKEGQVDFVAKRMYNLMAKIVAKYPQSDRYLLENSLKNKLDEAEKYIWPNGKR